MRAFLDGDKTCVFQWDNNRRLILYEFPEGCVVAYSNKCAETAPVVEAYTENGILYANIPPEIMQEPHCIEADIRLGGNTIHKTFVTLIPGARPDDYAMEPVEVLRYETLAKRIPFDDNYEGMILYVVGGVAVPLKLGPGLSIRDGVLYVSGGTGEPDDPVGVVVTVSTVDGVEVLVDSSGQIVARLDGTVEVVTDSTGTVTASIIDGVETFSVKEVL